MQHRRLKVFLDEVCVGNRIRQDPGDLGLLKASMERVGLLQPIIIDTQYNLLAGFRRLQAAHLLGWESIDAHMVEARDKETRLLIELEENITRKDFTPEQLDIANRRLTRYGRKGVVWKIVNWMF